MDISGRFLEDFWEILEDFREISERFPGDFPEISERFPGRFPGDVPGDFPGLGAGRRRLGSQIMLILEALLPAAWC